jgi:hypothetical protein
VAAAAKKSLDSLYLLFGSVEGQVRSVTQQSEALRQAFNQNHLAYSQAIGTVDGHIAVLRAVINDMQKGDLSTDAEGNIDWAQYYTWYNEMVEQERVAAKGSGSQVTAEEVQEEIFGGDYGVRQVSEGEQQATSKEVG